MEKVRVVKKGRRGEVKEERLLYRMYGRGKRRLSRKNKEMEGRTIEINGRK